MTDNEPAPARPPENAGRWAALKPWVKLAIFIILAVAAFIAIRRTGLGAYFSQENMEALLAGFGPWAPVGYVALYAVGTMLAVPGTILTIIGGVVFGPVFGTLLIVIGATLGASGAFLIARFLARDFITQLFGAADWFRRLDDGIARYGLYFVLFVRLIPVLPFNGINFASGLTKVRFRDFFIGTFFGIIPASFIFANAASQAAGAAAGEPIGTGFYLSLALLGVLALIPVIYKKIMGGREDGKDAAHGG